MASQAQGQQPARLSVLSFGTAPPPDVAQLPTAVPLALYPQPHPATTDSITAPPPPPVDLTHVARTVLKAKRVAVVCGQSPLTPSLTAADTMGLTAFHPQPGAGISTASGIPDFRSGAGLFESLKKQYPEAKLSTGKDLFDVGLFAVSPPPLSHMRALSPRRQSRGAELTSRGPAQSETNAAIFFNMIAELKKQTDAVQPTAFHDWLKHLDDQGKLFRVYTQSVRGPTFSQSRAHADPGLVSQPQTGTLTRSKKKQG